MRIRLGTLLLLIVVAALALGLIVQRRAFSRREAQLEAELRQGRMELQAVQQQSRKELRAAESRMQTMARKYINIKSTSMRPAMPSDVMPEGGNRE